MAGSMFRVPRVFTLYPVLGDMGGLMFPGGGEATEICPGSLLARRAARNVVEHHNQACAPEFWEGSPDRTVTQPILPIHPSR